MIYDNLKIIHILSASFLLISIFLSVRTFLISSTSAEYLQKQTVLGVIPLTILQLISGFTMLSLQTVSLNTLWVKGSLLGFIILLIFWILFIYFAHRLQRKIAMIFLILSLMTLCSMIFLMSSKI